jgi:hypothetical protein
VGPKDDAVLQGLAAQLQGLEEMGKGCAHGLLLWLVDRI